jgi:soluble lytic murein transglycosylase
MRLGQIYLSQGKGVEAAQVFREYLETFPDGRRWDEAAFWAGRTLLSLGLEEEASALLDELRRRFPLSYYSVQSGLLLHVPYDPGIPEAVSTPQATEVMTEGLARVDALRRAGMTEGVGWEIDGLSASIRDVEDLGTRRGLLLRLALELNERGLTREGINLGWEVRRLGGEWDRDLLSAIYPFPYREMVFREATERELDPFLMAGLMRQESAFWHEARSRADARGLMQVRPGTGAELARARGPRGFDADEHLYRPEINVHLGMAFFADLRRRFGEDLSILLSAYNAGPTRARRWREYPEAGDLVRFVERIPFTETRGYVKNVLLNREIYAWLYGPAAVEGS